MKRTSWWLFASLLLLAGCREHVLDDGTYTLTPTRTLRDDCGLARPDFLGEATLRTEGHLASLSLASPALVLTGSYRYGLEQLVLDGSLLNHPATLAGRACLLDTVSYHLETQSTGPTAFTGALSIDFQAVRSDACACKYWLELEGQRR